MKFQPVKSSDIPVIQHITNTTWPIAYGEILSKEQLKYMLEKFYSTSALTLKINQKSEIFYIAKDENDSVLGFFSIEHNFELEQKSKIHKIYILPENQGKGIGKLVLEEAIGLAKLQKQESVVLNVNRFNKALYFYQKMDFEIIQTIDIEIGDGYLMEDFILQLKITN
jgi:ribosomal protein S18 acetylase RimI-like enzyme